MLYYIYIIFLKGVRVYIAYMYAKFNGTVMLGYEDLSLLVNSLSEFFRVLAAFPEFCIWRKTKTRSFLPHPKNWLSLLTKLNAS